MEVKNKYQNSKETQLLLSGWTAELANWLMAEESMGRAKAFRKAHLTRRLLDALGKGEVKFRYMKRDGEERKARGTLCRGVCEGYDHYKYKDHEAFARARECGTYVYFDLDRQGFRSFRAKDLIEIIKE